MILTRPELVTLTGRRTRAGQMRVLAANRIPYIIAADGWPRVHEAALLESLGVVRLPARTEREPNYAAIRPRTQLAAQMGTKARGDLLPPA